jgi:D-alanyl-D-alanine carboxypeptidase
MKLLILTVVILAVSAFGFLLPQDTSHVAMDVPVGVTVDTATAIDHLSSEINTVLHNRVIRGSTMGVKVYSLSSRKDIFAYRASDPVTPASTMKLLTSSTALSLFGPSYKIRTEIRADNFSKGTVGGNIYIKGFGDPTFSIHDLDSLVQELRNIGLRKVTGDVIGDGSYFDQVYQRVKYSGDPEMVEATPPVSALVLDRNAVTIIASSGAAGEKVRLQTIPHDPNIVFVDNARTGGAKPAAHAKRKKRRAIAEDMQTPHIIFASYVMPVRYGRHLGKHKRIVHSSLSFSESYSKSGKEVVTVSGRLPLGRTVSHHIEFRDPTLSIAAILKARLESEGIEVGGDATTGKAPVKTQVLVKKETPLLDVLALLNKNSDNYAAEQVFKMIGAEKCCVPGMDCGLADTSVKYIKAFLNSSHINTAQCSIHDGSGLSHRAQVTPNLVVGILEKMHGSDSLFKPFYNTMGVAGVDGTIHHRMIGTSAENDVHAKTGTLNGVSALAGYVNTRDGELWAFDITMNNTRVYSARKIQDKIVELLAGFSYNANQ